VFFDALHPGLENSIRVVLKIGGSISRRAETLLPVLEVVARARRPLVVVPGGGTFADAVRDAQPLLGFSDRTAHRMAILALHQNALMIAERVPELRKLEAIDDIEHGLLQGQKLIWLPLRECEEDSALPATWQATSDAIAARLAWRLGGLPLIFIKSRSLRGNRDPASLAAEELIDPVCANMLERSGSPFTIIEAGQTSILAKLLGVDANVDAQPRA
jgi:5-(aminomethyl)-3-furanmethanol phosphate kinase